MSRADSYIKGLTLRKIKLHELAEICFDFISQHLLNLIVHTFIDW